MFLLLGVLALAALTAGFWALHLKRLRYHEGISRDDFVSHFQTAGVDPRISTTVYHHFLRNGFWRNFQPSPTDRLDVTYRTVDEDLEETLAEILRELDLEMPHSGVLLEWEMPIETISDVTRWVDWVSKHQCPSSPS